MNSRHGTSTKCRRCGKSANIPDHTFVCIDCYFDPLCPRLLKVKHNEPLVNSVREP